MTREVTNHQIDNLPEGFASDLTVIATEEDRFGIPHEYSMVGADPDPAGTAHLVVEMKFQSGDPRKGWNGGTSLAYLAAIHDFLVSCEKTQFACPENFLAITHLTSAIDALKARIIRRAAEGTFQTHQPEKP